MEVIVKEITNLDQFRYTFSSEKEEKLYTGIQALVAAPLLMRKYDRALGRNTAGYVSGYRGSPLAGLDKEFTRAQEHLIESHIRFQFGMNEDFAATSLYGTQMLHLFPKPKYDGVFGMWYGKGPGVDRAGDVFKHANGSGTASLGGVLAVAGDDHTCKSSTMPHQSGPLFTAMKMPYLAPSDVGDILSFAVRGWELSRASGSWIGFTVVADLADATESVVIDPHPRIIVPEMELPEGGLNIRWPDDAMDQEMRIHRYRLEMAKRFVRQNGLNVMTHDANIPRLGIVTSGKSYRDVLEAFRLLGLSQKDLQELGIRVMKIGMPWPLDVESMRAFLHGLPSVLVVEEKRDVIESQLKAGLYHGSYLGFGRPNIAGKQSVSGVPYLPETGELTSASVAIAIAEQLPGWFMKGDLFARVRRLREIVREGERHEALIDLKRIPYYCSGCPHNTSTKVIEGSIAGAGIGCHFMATKMDQKARGSTIEVTPMGQEGTQFIGLKDFTETRHFFQNLGDGTYFHSGSLAIRAAVAAKLSITFKILYNDAVAMTGGQKLDGELSVQKITQQMYHEGVRRITVVSDDITKYGSREGFAPQTTFHHRSTIEALQRELREYRGVSILVYDQTCAAEKRRRRKKGEMEDPPMRPFINERVCEGCGDCSQQSNCLSVEPVETEYGRKRKINQSSCNKDYSCLSGFCPSFVTVDGAPLRQRATMSLDMLSDCSDIPEPRFLYEGQEHNILLAGIGGTGILTTAQILTTAGFLAGMKGVMGLDITGMSQKYGGVLSHVRLSSSDELGTPKIPLGGANILLAADLVSALDRETLALLSTKEDGGVCAVVNSHVAPTAAFIHDPDLSFPLEHIKKELAERTRGGKPVFLDATLYAERLFGDAIYSNIFLLGALYQEGLVPIPLSFLERAIELNGANVKVNTMAFRAGRCAAADPRRFAERLGTVSSAAEQLPLGTLLANRANDLSHYQDPAYGARYTSFVGRVWGFEAGMFCGSEKLTRAVAENYYKLLAYKDEYEVARLYTDGEFLRSLQETFDGAESGRLRFHLAPPLFSKKDPHTGHLIKKEYGSWIFTAMHFLAKLKCLRGTMFDPFGYTRERKKERELIKEYEMLIDILLARTTRRKLERAVELASIPQMIRGYGHIKEGNIEKARMRRNELLTEFLKKERLNDIPVKGE